MSKILDRLRLSATAAFDRRALRERLAQLATQHEAAAHERQARLDSAQGAYERWRDPEADLQRVKREAVEAARREAHERDRIESELQAHPPACVVALGNFVDAAYSRTKQGDLDAATLNRLGEALVAATIFCRDEGWRLPDNQAQEECRRLRAAIDAAFGDA